MTVYRIAKWSDVFETAESRRLKQLNWVAMPIALTSNGYQSMLDDFEDKAPAMYGAWCALVAVAGSCPVRGLLCNSRGQPLKLGHIARRTGFSDAIILALMDWASQPHIHWLEPLSEADAKNELSQVPVKQGTSDHPAAAQQSPSNDPAATQQIAGLPNPTLPYQTQPDITQHQPNQTGVVGDSAGGSVGGLSVEEILIEGLDLEEVRLQASKLRKATQAIDVEDVWQAACIAEMVSPGFLSTLATDVKNHKVRKPQGYIDSSFRRVCAEKGVDLAKLRRLCPPCPVKEAAT